MLVGHRRANCAFLLLQSVGVSAVTGQGVDEFFTAIDAAAVEYEK